MTVFAVEQKLWDQTVFNHVRCAPLTGDHRVVAKVPPKIVSKILWSTLNLPAAEHIEGGMVQQEDSTRTFAFGISQTTYINPFRPAMNRVESGITGLFKDFVGFNDLTDLRFSWIGFGIKDVNSR